MKASTIFIPVFISVAMLLPKRTTVACGFYIVPGEYRFWLMQPDITSQPDLTPFYFASGYLYKQDLGTARETYIDDNTEEWFQFLQQHVPKQDIDELLNDTDPQLFFDKEKANLPGNRFLQSIQNTEVYKYIVLSKKVEQVAFNNDPWEEAIFPNKNISAVIKEVQAFHPTNPFLKLRTAYQLTRLYNYNHQYRLSARLYDSIIAPVNTDSWIKTAALYQKTFGVGYDSVNYWLSKVFDRGNFHKSLCLVRFSSSTENSPLRLAKNQHERNVIMAMQTYNQPGRSLQALRSIYAFEPRYKELPFLLLRELNKVEDWLLTSKVTSSPNPAVYGESYLDNAALNYRNDIVYAGQLYDFIKTMIHDRVHPQQALLHLYASHLCLILGNQPAAVQHLQSAKAFKGLAQNIQTQIRISSYLSKLENGFDKTTEEEFIGIMKTPAEKLGIYDPEIMKNQLVLYTARKLMLYKQRAKGLMLLSRTNRVFGEMGGLGYQDVYQEIQDKATASNYDEMLALLDKKEKSPLERFIVEGHFRVPWETNMPEEVWTDENTNWSRHKLLDLKASCLIRQHRLEEALVALQQIPDSVWHNYPYDEHLKGDPFFLNVNHPWSPTTDEKRQYTKRQAVEQMVHLQQLAKQDKTKAAWCYYQLGNAWYNMSYYGKSWLMVKRWWSGGEAMDKVNLTDFNDDYFGCREAHAYYQQAIKTTKDKKLASLCYFMVQQCNRNYRQYRNNDDDDWTPNYKLAAQDGIDVTYYRSVVEECELYQSFIKQYSLTTP